MRERYGQALRLASTLHLSRDEWLKIHQVGIGSSDAAAAIGLSPYKCALSLWLEKTGRKAPEDLSQKEPVLWGTILEPGLAGFNARLEFGKGKRPTYVTAAASYPVSIRLSCPP